MSRSYSNIGGPYVARSRTFCIVATPSENRAQYAEKRSPSGLSGAIYLGDLQVSNQQDALILEFLYNLRESYDFCLSTTLRAFASGLKRSSDAYAGKVPAECRVSQAHVGGGFIYFTVRFHCVEKNLYAKPEDFHLSRSMLEIARIIRIREYQEEAIGFYPVA